MNNHESPEVVGSEEQVNVLMGGNGAKPRNMSTICIHCTRGMVPVRVVQAWRNLIVPMNHRYIEYYQTGMDADVALNTAIEDILENPVWRNYPYILLYEDDNLAPRDGLLSLLRTIGDYDGIGGLYSTKGIPAFPLVLGHPSDPMDFRPIMDATEGIVECNGTGVGFVLLKTEIFKKLSKPWFRSVEVPEPGINRMQHDLYFFWKAKKELGCRFAVNTAVKVGHLNTEDGVVYWPEYVNEEEAKRLKEAKPVTEGQP